MDYWSEWSDPAYFGDVSYSILGQESSPIMGYSVLADTLVTHKQGEENGRNAFVRKGELDLSKVPAHSDEEIRAAIAPVVNATVERINKNVAKRNAYLKEWGDKEGPYLYIIVALSLIHISEPTRRS
mgnify:CR=1 FL=1